MNELKPEDVMKALECCSKSNGVDACMSGCPLWETDTCPCVEDEAALMKSALALLREKDAEIERLSHQCSECAGCTQWKCDCSNIRDEAITEFAERLKSEVNGGQFASYKGLEIRNVIDQIAKEMKEGKR